PVPMNAVSTPTPARSTSVSRTAVGSTLAARCDHSSSEPADAVTNSEAIGAATSSATTPAAISHGFHRGRLTEAAVPLLIEADSIDESAGRIAVARDL